MESQRTLRFELINVPAKLARAQGREELRIAASPDARLRYQETLAALDRAAYGSDQSVGNYAQFGLTLARRGCAGLLLEFPEP